MRFLTAINKYGKYAIPEGLDHRPAVTMALRGQVYEPETIQYMLDNCGDGIIIHAGMFFGDFLPALATLDNPVYGFEPVRDNFLAAVETVRMNEHLDTSNLNLINAGLGKDIAIAPIMTEDANGRKLGGGSRIAFDEGATDYIDITRIDSLDIDSSNVSIIQLDVEGYEQPALEGALETIRQAEPILILEQWFPDMLEAPFYQEHILGMGYKEVAKIHENVVLRK